MRRAALVLWGVAAVVAAGSVAGRAQAAAQSPAPVPAPQGTETQPAAVAGGKLHGTVKSGTIPLPGVTITAQNTLTGKKYSTTSDITGAWSMTLPQNGRYVIRTDFAAFAVGGDSDGGNADPPSRLRGLGALVKKNHCATESRPGAAEAFCHAKS